MTRNHLVIAIPLGWWAASTWLQGFARVMANPYAYLKRVTIGDYLFLGIIQIKFQIT